MIFLSLLYFFIGFYIYLLIGRLFFCFVKFIYDEFNLGYWLYDMFDDNPMLSTGFWVLFFCMYIPYIITLLPFYLVEKTLEFFKNLKFKRIKK